MKKYMQADDALDFLAAALPGTVFNTDKPDARQRAKAKLYKLAAEGVIPCLRIGRLVYFDSLALDTWIEQGGAGFAGGWRRNAAESA